MTESEKLCRVMRLALTRNEVVACEYLESRGLRFGREFMRDDCQKIAANEYLALIERAQATLVYDLSSRSWRKRA